MPFMFIYNQELRVSLWKQINLSRVLLGMRTFQNGQSERMTSLIIFFSLLSIDCMAITVDG